LEEQKKKEFENLLEEALLENRADFVGLFLKGVNLSKFLDEDRLKRLYNNEAVSACFNFYFIFKTLLEFSSLEKNGKQLNHLYYF
jgi:hypothetical protein